MLADKGRKREEEATMRDTWGFWTVGRPLESPERWAHPDSTDEQSSCTMIHPKTPATPKAPETRIKALITSQGGENKSLAQRVANQLSSPPKATITGGGILSSRRVNAD